MNDYDLTNISKHLDTKSRLQLMQVCKRFQLLIGNDEKFFNQFRLKLSVETLDDPDFENIVRYFGSVFIKKINCKENGEHFTKILNLFKIIGEKITSLDFLDLKINNLNLLQLLKETPNLKRLNMANSSDRMDFGEGKADGIECKLPKLEEVTLKNVDQFEMISKVAPNTLKVFMYEKINWHTCSLPLEELLSRQHELRVLKLWNVDIAHFNYSTENRSLRSLTLHRVRFFPERETDAFKNFVNFVKQQTNVETLNLDLSYEYVEQTHNFQPVFCHLLSLSSLKSLTIRDPERYLENLVDDVCNPFVKTLKLKIVAEFDCRTVARLFPNILTLELDYSAFGFGFARVLDLTPINACGNLRSFKSNWLPDEMLERIHLQKLDSVNVQYVKNSSDGNSEVWRTFIKKHDQLKRVNIFKSFLALEHLEILIKNLPNLELLNLATIYGAAPANLAVLIREMPERLRKFSLRAVFPHKYEATAVFMNLQNVKICAKELSGQSAEFEFQKK